MAKTPDVVPDELIESRWGNEIRNRTIQQFANLAELKTWAAPDGCTAYAAGIWYIRHKSKWYGSWLASQLSTSSDGDGNVKVPWPADWVYSGLERVMAHNATPGAQAAWVGPELFWYSVDSGGWAAVLASNIDGGRWKNSSVNIHYLVMTDIKGIV